MIAFALPLLKKGLGLIPWAKVALYLLGAVVALFMYLTWKHNIEQASLAKFNADQMQELVKNQKEIKEKLQAFDELQQKYYENAEQYRKDLEKKLSGINNFLASDEAKKMDRPASPLLKKTFEELRKNQ